MQPEDQISDHAREELRRSLIDPDNIAARMQYVSAIAGLIISVADWLAIDSWLGGGKVTDVKVGEETGEAGQAFSEFRAVSTVACMAAELAGAAVDMARKERYYAVGALVRQLIECEYLVTLFSDDLEYARRWRESTPDEVRMEFTPKRMRRLTASPTRSTGTTAQPAGTRPRRAPACLRSSIRPASRGRILLPSSSSTSACIFTASGGRSMLFS